MAFVRSKSPTYFAPAALNTLDADGKLIVSKFDLQFKRHTKTQLKDLDDRIKAWPVEDLPNRDRTVLSEVMTGWRAVTGPDGKEDLPFSMATVDELDEEYPGFVKACVQAFYLSTEPGASAHLAAKN